MAEKPSFSDILVQGRNILKQAGIEDWELDAWYLLGHITAMGRAEYFLRELEMVPENIVDEYYKLINIRASHVPLQHITGSQEFMGLNFLVSSDVLVPRQDTETLVEYLLPYVKNKHVLDICTGSGCIAISIMKLGGAALCRASDYSKKALSIAKENAVLNSVDIEFVYSNMFENITGSYDIIVSNPPYIRTEVIGTLMPEVREHEPLMALDGGEDGLGFYKIIGSEARSYLRQDGIIAVETGYDQGRQVMDIFKECGYKNVCVQKDLSGTDRVVAAIMP